MANKPKKRAKKARTWRDVLGTKRDPLTNLYRAVCAYVEANGGSLIVIGDVSLIQMPEDRDSVFRVAVKVMGRRPTLVKS